MLAPISELRALYRPIQPTVRKFADHVSYVELLPDTALQPYIYCYWQLRTERELTKGFCYRVVADGCIDIFFDLDAPKHSYVMGFCRRFTEFQLENSFNYAGIRFLPGMLPLMFRVNAMTLSNRYEHLSAVLPEVADFITNGCNGGLMQDDIKSIMDGYFLNWLSSASCEPDNRLYNAIAVILKNCGVVDIEKGLDTGISTRQLRRLFEYYIGDTVKNFCRVVRFQNVLKAKPSTQSLRQNKLFFDMGYYDQSHFIKEFRNFYGVTPGEAFEG